MAKVGRPGLSEEQKREVWRRWLRGESLSEIGRALGRIAGVVHTVVSANGGIVPAERTRAAITLSLAEREEISRGLARTESLRAIAARLRRWPSTISREVHRHGGRARYRALTADERAWENTRRPKPCLRQRNLGLRELVAAKLAADWSPEHIAGWLARHGKPSEGMSVSHETIYRSLFVQARGVLRKELTRHLRTRRTMRRAKHQSVGRTGICFDNAMAESFFGTLKNERVHRITYRTRHHARADISAYIEIRYNRQRLHSAINYRTPHEVHRAYQQRLRAA